jgi:hypothetical protein
MWGCDSCGAQARRDDRACPICGAPLGAATPRAGRAHIPVRRYGEVPPYPVEYEEMLEEDGPGLPQRGRFRLAPLALAAVSALLLAAGAGYWLR